MLHVVHPAAGGHQSPRKQAVVGQVQVGHPSVPPQWSVFDETRSGCCTAGQTAPRY